ncbi:hypothetical protein L7F22_008442 [Adiantum nelumboides]|nr:hypothetical protein [Adiantum nelumboides]
MKLQLADGYIETPLGLLEQIVVTFCGIKFEHTFAVVDFGEKPNYKIILGCPFMRKLKMIQDWGYNYLYLRHPNVLTRVDLKHHSYKDVVNTPVRDLVSTVANEDSIPSWLIKNRPVWLRDAQEDSDREGSSSTSDYIAEPFPEIELEPFGWQDILATLDVCANVHATRHCDDNGYDIQSMFMVHVLPAYESVSDSTSYDEDIILEGPNADTSRITSTRITNSESEVPFIALRMEISSVEDMIMDEPEPESRKQDKEMDSKKTELEVEYDALDANKKILTKLKRKMNKTERKKARVSRAKIRKGLKLNPTHINRTPAIQQYTQIQDDTQVKGRELEIEETQVEEPPTISGKKQFLNLMEAQDCIKDTISKCYLMQLQNSKAMQKTTKPVEKEIPARKPARKSKSNKLELKTNWEEPESSHEKLTTPISVPEHYKKYTFEERKIVITKPERTMNTLGVSYDGPEDAKKIDLSSPGEDPKPVYIATDLSEQEEIELVKMLIDFRDIFAWSYKDLKGVDPAVCQHTIPLWEDAKPSKHRPYSYNDNYVAKINEEIDRLKEAGFIFEIEHTEWVSPLVVVPKKNGKLRVCVNLKKVNAATIRDNYPLPITDHVIETVAGAEAYSFLDGFSGYNQVSIDIRDQHKTAFATEWGTFAYRVMPPGLTNAPSTFRRLMCHIFKEFLRKFLEIYVDDLCVHSKQRLEHLSQLRSIFEKCRLYRLCLNPEKCAFMVRQGKILGHIVSKNRILTD